MASLEHDFVALSIVQRFWLSREPESEARHEGQNTHQTIERSLASLVWQEDTPDQASDDL